MLAYTGRLYTLAQVGMGRFMLLCCIICIKPVLQRDCLLKKTGEQPDRDNADIVHERGSKRAL